MGASCHMEAVGVDLAPVDTLAERTLAAMRARGLSGKDVETAGRLSAGYVSRVTKGHRLRLGPEVMQRLAIALRVDYQWLATGKGDMGPDVKREIPAHLDPYPNRAKLLASPDFEAQPAAVRDWFRSRRCVDGDRSELEWAEVLTLGRRMYDLRIMADRHGKKTTRTPD